MKVSTKSVLAALVAALVVSPAFAQSGGSYGRTQTKTTSTKSTAQKSKSTAPKDHKYSGKVVSASASSFTIKQGKKDLTIETAGATATQGKKPFDLSTLTVGTKVTVRGTMSGSEVMAHKIVVGKLHTEQMKSSTKTSSHAKKSTTSGSKSSGGTYGSGGNGAFHGIGG